MPKQASEQAHPAKFTDVIADAIIEITDGVVPPMSLVLDPFAGTGRIHEIGKRVGWETVGIEIEPEWAEMHPDPICDDSTKIHEVWPIRVGKPPFAIATSPCYGSRMADAHNAKESCKACGGTGLVVDGAGHDSACIKCKGEGRRSYKRNTYKHTLNRIDPKTGEVADLHPHNSGAMKFGKRDDSDYKSLHRIVWAEVAALKPRFFVLNVSDFIQGYNEDESDHVVQVTDWHLGVLAEHGFTEIRRIDVETPRQRFGANSERRVKHEHVILLERHL